MIMALRNVGGLKLESDHLAPCHEDVSHGHVHGKHVEHWLDKDSGLHHVPVVRNQQSHLVAVDLDHVGHPSEDSGAAPLTGTFSPLEHNILCAYFHAHGTAKMTNIDLESISETCK